MIPVTANQKERITVEYTGFQIYGDLHDRIVKSVGQEPVSTTVAGNRNRLEFEVWQPCAVMTRVRREIPECNVYLTNQNHHKGQQWAGGGNNWSNNFQNNQPYTPPPPKPKRKFRVTTDAGQAYIYTAFWDDDLTKEICWVRDHGFTIDKGGRVEPDQIAKIEVLPLEKEKTKVEPKVSDRPGDFLAPENVGLVGEPKAETAKGDDAKK